jgi:hypothetical protein
VFTNHSLARARASESGGEAGERGGSSASLTDCNTNANANAAANANAHADADDVEGSCTVQAAAPDIRSTHAALPGGGRWHITFCSISRLFLLGDSARP